MAPRRPADDHGRRDFLKAPCSAGAAAVTAAAMTAPAAQAQPGMVPGTRNHYYVPANDKTVHWGYFSKLLKPLVEVNSGDFVTIESLTHHANDDAERMVTGRSGRGERLLLGQAAQGRRPARRRPDAADAVRARRGRGLGVHICTGPVAVRGADAGRHPRGAHHRREAAPVRNPQFKGKTFGSNAAAWWGFHYKDLLTEPKPREVITIYEIDTAGRAQLGQGALQLPVDAADRSRSAWCTRSSTILACRWTTRPCRRSTAC